MDILQKPHYVWKSIEQKPGLQLMLLKKYSYWAIVKSFLIFFLERKKEKEKITKSNDVWLSSTHLVYYSYKLNEPFVFWWSRLC